ncbi:hypothetical protein CURE108131_25020 [Cupriavidus respiraculi]|uniref:Uncharacterized protein n=1 Tax=Cupriavidus respiraculi TaxID=195930 RepID=A0ABN7ZEU3_9BURK|nr:hypothetical protein [Cupriavidus respiraculi]CAG9184189.1 hypothetical protein LMG21510_05035 [Cupriavidus respiraculi]
MLIGFSGRPGAGQDDAADYLGKAHGFAVIRLDEPLRHILAGHLGAEAFLPAQLHALAKGYASTPHEFLATLRQHPALGHDTLALVARQQIEDTGPHPTVVPDVTNIAEAQLIRSLGGIVVRLTNSHAPHRGDEPAIPDDLIAQRIDVPDRPFPFFDLLDRLVEEQAWEEAAAA